jgi:hypothetical protein
MILAKSEYGRHFELAYHSPNSVKRNHALAYGMGYSECTDPLDEQLLVPLLLSLFSMVDAAVVVAV